ncbi:MAG: transposase [Nitrospirae bacterium]|nr:transposase [Nitrospirota bacterium]
MSVKELTKLTVTDLWRECKRSFREYWEEHEGAVKVFRKGLIEGALEAEQEIYVNCKSYERASLRKDYRNGYWLRWITLKDGRLEIRMPRIRGGGYESAIDLVERP